MVAPGEGPDQPELDACSRRFIGMRRAQLESITDGQGCGFAGTEKWAKRMEAGGVAAGRMGGPRKSSR